MPEHERAQPQRTHPHGSGEQPVDGADARVAAAHTSQDALASLLDSDHVQRLHRLGHSLVDDRVALFRLLGHVRNDQPGVHGQHVDLAFHLFSPAVAELIHLGLARRVHLELRRVDLAEERGHVDDQRLVRAHAERALRDVAQPRQLQAVEVQLRRYVGEAQLRELAVHGHARVVHEDGHVQVQEEALEVCEVFLRGALREVLQDDACLHGVGVLDLRGGALRLLRVAAHNDDVEALGCEVFGELQPDAIRRAGHNSPGLPPVPCLEIHGASTECEHGEQADEAQQSEARREQRV